MVFREYLLKTISLQFKCPSLILCILAEFTFLYRLVFQNTLSEWWSFYPYLRKIIAKWISILYFIIKLFKHNLHWILSIKCIVDAFTFTQVLVFAFTWRPFLQHFNSYSLDGLFMINLIFAIAQSLFTSNITSYRYILNHCRQNSVIAIVFLEVAFQTLFLFFISKCKVVILSHLCIFVLIVKVCKEIKELASSNLSYSLVCQILRCWRLSHYSLKSSFLFSLILLS